MKAEITISNNSYNVDEDECNFIAFIAFIASKSLEYPPTTTS